MLTVHEGRLVYTFSLTDVPKTRKKNKLKYSTELIESQELAEVNATKGFTKATKCGFQHGL